MLKVQKMAIATNDISAEALLIPKELKKDEWMKATHAVAAAVLNDMQYDLKVEEQVEKVLSQSDDDLFNDPVLLKNMGEIEKAISAKEIVKKVWTDWPSNVDPVEDVISKIKEQSGFYRPVEPQVGLECINHWIPHC